MSQRHNIRLAVLMTCHNRRDQTQACLTALKQQVDCGVMVRLYLVDDGSTDGTADAVLAVFPDAMILRGDGNLYWCGGMRFAFATAMRDGHDFYLWLNDDTLLYRDAVSRMLATHDGATRALSQPTIVVGSTCDQMSGAMTYGGWIEKERLFGPRSWRKIAPDPALWCPCATINGNCVLIPRGAAELAGNLDRHFIHGIGDLDYGLRARRLGCQIVIAPGYLGACKVNDGTGLWTDVRQPVHIRWKKLLGPKGIPVKAWGFFACDIREFTGHWSGLVLTFYF